MERVIHADLTEERGSRMPLRLWLLPIAGTIAYPFLLSTYSAVAHAGVSGSGTSLQRLALFTAAAALMAAAITVPFLALKSLLQAGTNNLNGVETRFPRRLLHIAAANPPIYILTLQLTAALGAGAYLNILWCGAWILTAAAIRQRTLAIRRGESSRASSDADSIITRWIPTLRITHGAAALTLLLIFLAAHLANHLVALWTVGAHQSVMKTLRLWYRAPWVEPVILALCVVMIATGLALAAFHTRTAGDRYRTVQTVTGAYLVAFMLAHTNAVLSGRSVHAETDWVFASGGPPGLLLGTAYYLIPYYPLAVLAITTHVALGLRIVLLGHKVEPHAAARATYAISALGALAAVLITTALFGVHVGG